MLDFKLTLSGLGGELDSRVVWVSADDSDGLRLKVVEWLESEQMILSAGDTITIQPASQGTTTKPKRRGR